VSPLRIETVRVPFAEAAGFGEAHIWARLAAGDLPDGYPALTLGGAGRSSGSEFLDRAAAAESVARQNPEMPSPPADARYVVTGQQPGLLTGPLYTVLKAITAVGLSERLSAESGSPVLPLFWVASEDHDVLEVNRVTVRGRRFVHEYDGDLSRGKVHQVADIDIAAVREPLLEFLRETLPETEFTPRALDTVASADYSSYASAFAGIMREVFAGTELRLVDPIALRPLTAPVLAECAARWDEVTAAFERGSAEVRSAGIEPPLAAPGLFEIVGTGRARVAVEFSGGGAKLSAGEVTLAEAADEIRRRPLEFSSGAALRPVVQDAVLPVVATVGGPAECAYLWQIGDVYAAVGVTRSLVAPRISATIVEQKIIRAARKAGLAPESVLEAHAMLSSHELEVDASPGIARVEEAAAELLARVDAAAADIVPAGESPRWLRKGRSGVEQSVSRIAMQLREERRKAAGLGRDRLEKIVSALTPGGQPQERSANVMEFLDLYGPELVSALLATLDPLAAAHQLAMVSASPGPGEGE